MAPFIETQSIIPIDDVSDKVVLPPKDFYSLVRVFRSLDELEIFSSESKVQDRLARELRICLVFVRNAEELEMVPQSEFLQAYVVEGDLDTDEREHNIEHMLYLMKGIFDRPVLPTRGRLSSYYTMDDLGYAEASA